MNPTLIHSGGDETGVRTLKLVRLRVGVFADGTAVGERQSPHRVVHVVDIAADLDAPEGVFTACGVPFAPGTLVEVPWMTLAPHKGCRQRSPIRAELYQSRIDERAKTVLMDDAHSDMDDSKSVSTGSSVSIRVTAQWSVNDPVVYVNHAAESECVDLAISGPDKNDVITHFQLTSPLDVLTAGHALVNAGLSLAETPGYQHGRVESRYAIGLVDAR